MWGDYHLREAALYVKRSPKAAPYLHVLRRLRRMSKCTARRERRARHRRHARHRPRGRARAGARRLDARAVRPSPRDEVADVVDELASLGVDAEYWPADIGSAERPAQLLVVGRRALRHAARAREQRRPRAARARRSARGDRRELRGGDAHQSAGPLLSDAGGRAAAHAAAGAQTSAPRAIVFVTSVSAEMASPHRGEYCVSKAGLSMAAQIVRGPPRARSAFRCTKCGPASSRPI